MVLNEHQLEIMRATYPGFREKDMVVSHVKADQRRYKTEDGKPTGYEPFREGMRKEKP